MLTHDLPIKLKDQAIIQVVTPLLDRSPLSLPIKFILSMSNILINWHAEIPSDIDAVFCSFYQCCEKYAVLYYLPFIYLFIYVVRNMQSFVLVFLFISTYATHPIYNFFFFFDKPISLKTKHILRE